MHGLDWYDYEARNYEPVLSRFTTPDPLAEKYYSISPYAYCAGNPVMFVDPDGRAWKPTFDEDHDENRTPNGYEWIDEDESYDSKGNLLPGLYSQAIFFSDNGTFDYKKDNNIGSSTATVYLADGTTQSFDAMTNPSSSDYVIIPEGTYYASVGKHGGKYIALRMTDKNNSGRIELGKDNPSDPSRTYAVGINIHKPGRYNFTSVGKDDRAVSQGCLLIDIYNWSNFINIFNTDDQRNNTIGITVSRSINSPININRTPAFNFILNGARRDFFKYKPLKY